jgi:hypothetical protein
MDPPLKLEIDGELELPAMALMRARLRVPEKRPAYIGHFRGVKAAAGSWD